MNDEKIQILDDKIIATILQNMDTNQKAFLGLANRINILENK